METMTLTINLPRDIVLTLENKAKISGRDSAEYVEDLITKELSSPSIDEILAPFRKQVEESGINDEDLNNLFTNSRKQVFKAKKESQKV
jgi:hypothetical protein